jgi:hypothetical protein
MVPNIEGLLLHRLLVHRSLALCVPLCSGREGQKLGRQPVGKRSASGRRGGQAELRLARIARPSSSGRVNCGQCPVGRST